MSNLAPVSFLLVDDLEENLLSLEALLRRDGLVQLMARSGDEALELLLRHDVALALVDVQMPGLTGFELAELMRGNERTRRIPIIFLTAGTADSQRRFRGYEAGAVDFIQKPIEADVLRSKAEVFFELYRQRQQIAAQRDELVAQAEALQEADRRKDEFLATLAHELRNPLAPLRHGLDTLNRDPGRDSVTRIHQMMDRQVTHLVRLIDDLLDVSRVSEGKIVLRKQRIAVDEVIRAAVEASTPLIDASGHALLLDVREAPSWLEADPTRLSQIVGNLLNNAAKYTPSGGRIALSVRSEGGWVAIRVTDNGVGIPLEMQHKVFDLFAQVENHLESSHGGLGIGLALVKKLVALHEGEVEVTSGGTGKGSTFTVRLPLATAPMSASDQPNLAFSETVKALKVLVVDDNEIVAETIGWLLEAIGHDYQVINDGRQTLNTAREYRPDVILLDIGLPGMDGYQVCRMLRADEEFRHTAIVAQTGWGARQDKELAAEAGFDHHLTKPVSLEDLEKLLASIKSRASGA